MKRRGFIRLLGGGVVLAAAGGGAWQYASRNVFPVPDSAVAAWQSAATQADPRRFALAHAILAPNPHNMQPWIADLGAPDTIDLRLDPERLLPATDPFGRQILMGLGAFLELLALAAAEQGQRADIALFPDGVPGDYLDDRRVATVRLIAEPDIQRDPLFAMIGQRRTDRRAYDPARAVTPDEIAALKVDAGLPGLSLDVVADPARVETLRGIARRAWATELNTEPAMMESMHVLRVGTAEIDRHRDGIVIDDPVLVLLAKTGLFDRSVMPAAGSAPIRAQIEDFEAATASTPAYLTIVTPGNSRAEQVAAGRAYARANLAGTGLGLAMHPNQQSLQEYPEVAEHRAAVHRELTGGAPGATVQMLARLGHLPAATPGLDPAPRRGLDAHLTG